MEKLNRGLLAVRTSSSQVYISWRLFGTDPSTIAFVLYRGNTKITPTPITDRTNFVDATSTNDIYTIKAVFDGVEQAYSESASVWAQQYLTIPLQTPAAGTTPDGASYTYSANDCSVGDLDGDGEYEIVLKWDPSNSHDNAHPGYTGNVYLDAYKLNGTRLWRIDLGRNIRAGAHYTQFMVYDLDGDEEAEVACKTADGTKDGTDVVIGNPNVDYRNSNGYIRTGPEFLTIFNGRSGKAMATTDFVPARGTVTSWGDNYGNRVDRFIAAVAYVDGKKPSLIMGRGYYTRLVRVAWDWRNGKLTRRWTFDSSSSTAGNSKYAGQGNHQMSVGDVDGDGKDEICNGASTIDDNGMGLYANGKGHGDALHMTDIDPDRPGQEVWQCYEDVKSYGTTGLGLHDAKTGQTIWGIPATGDVGRAMAADIDPRHKGLEVWGATGGLYNCKGIEIATNRPSMNFGIWWDHDLSRELLDGTVLDKWDYTRNSTNRLMTFYKYGSVTDNNGSKKNPGLVADLIGDWREEVIFRSSDNKNLLLFTTVIPTSTRIYTLMHDPQYRVAVAWQNSAYNQPPHPGFYLGTGMSEPPKPNIVLA
jgi:rhamnogalacturonan endolyase